MNKNKEKLLILTSLANQAKTESSRLFENQETKWLTTKEAADYLRLSPKSLLNMVSNGQVPCHKLQRRNRYLESELRRLLQANPKGEFYGN